MQTSNCASGVHARGCKQSKLPAKEKIERFIQFFVHSK
jgi:hypothetical protein